ncbi:DUF6221 family protein [Nocardioides sp.]|uniref:DUF6221 family protein n=1 Tax=Nocardioides sp. TaxID=35761 RepID=UPI003783FBBE
MPDPVPFLADRITEDRVVADALRQLAETLPPALFPRTREDPDVVFVAGVDIGAGQPDRFLRLGHPEAAQYMSHFHLLRAEREEAAKKNLMAIHGRSVRGACSLCVAIADDRPVPLPYPCPTLVLLTWAYADHPDFDEAWATPEERWR